jgi:predicted lipid-binding transport protein (Tim44 family)
MVILGLGVGVIIVVVVAHRLSNAGNGSPSGPPQRPREPINRPDGLEAFLAANPGFDPGAFAARVPAAFMKIQQAWTEQDLSRVRRFISDGMYQRFATQFRMMGLLRQRNLLDEVQIHGVRPVAFRIDGAYDVIDVWISAAMDDLFACELDPSMNSQGNEPFVEYWSFIRKRGARNSRFDIFADHSCPACGAGLPENLGELCRCGHCQVLVNSGEFDWVLAEITQEADYGAGSRMASLVTADLKTAIDTVAPECPDFSRQLVEDKASNAFMQLMTAHATRNPALVRRFVDDQLFGAISAAMPDRNIIFNRLYLNESVLLNMTRHGAKHRLAIGLSASMQRVELLSPRHLALLDAEEQRRDFILTLERDVDAVAEKGSLYQHQCATCGGAVGDTLDVTCQYCGSALNSTRHEWIVCGFEGN